MSIFDRYLIKEILKHFGIVLSAAIVIYLVIDFFENIDRFMEAGLPLSRALEFFQLKVPLIIVQITPVGILLAVLITFGLMNKNNEIIALKSGGMSIYHFLKPILMLGLLFTVGYFILAEIVVPITTSKANEIWRFEVKKYAVTAVRKNIWIKGHRSIAYISYFNPQDQSISGIATNYFDKQFRLTRRVDAAKARYQNKQWIFYDVMEQKLNDQNGSYAVTFADQQVEDIDFSPEDLKKIAKKSEEMNFKELYRYIHDVESEGYDATPYRVDLQGKFALPLSCIIVSLIGSSITLRKTTREGLSMSIAYGMVIVFLYWITQSFCSSLGYGGLLPPYIAAWTANFLFACLAVFNFLNAE
jgi:lipopolysaccharide export system permease protein